MISHVAAILKIVMYPNVGFNIAHTFGEVAGWEGLFHDICVGNSKFTALQDCANDHRAICQSEGSHPIV